MQPVIRPLLILLWAISLLLVFLLSQKFCKQQIQCPQYEESVRWETTYVAAKPVEFKKKPKLNKAITRLDSTIQNGVVKLDSIEMAYFSDTFKDNRFQAVINDTLEKNRIVRRGFNISWNDPIITKAETQIVKVPFRPKVQVYIGAGFIAAKNDWGIGPSAVIAFPATGIAVQYNYEARLNRHLGGVYYMLKFRK